MIKINLLPQGIRREEGTKKQIQLVIIGMITLVVVLVLFYVWKILVYINMKKEFNQVNAKLETMNSIVARVEQLQSQKAVLDRKWGIIEQLMKNQFTWARILDEFTGCIPKNIWLTSLGSSGGDGGKVLSLTGEAFTNFDIADFINSLEDSDFFSNVELISIQESAAGGKEVSTLHFNLTMRETL